MSVGFWKKAFEVVKKVGNGIKNVVGKVLAPVASIAAPIISAIPHPAAQAIGRGMGVVAPIVQRLTGE